MELPRIVMAMCVAMRVVLKLLQVCVWGVLVQLEKLRDLESEAS